MLTLDWLWGRPQALLQRRNVSSVRVGLANDTKRTPLQNWGNPLSELHAPHRQCLAVISNAFSASFTSIWPSFPLFYCTPNKACLLCATPAGTYRVQSLGFPKIGYWHFGCVLISSLQCRFRAQRQMNQIMRVSYGYELYDVMIQYDGNIKLLSTSDRTTSKSITQSVSGSATFEFVNILHDDSNWIVTSSSPHRLALGRTTAVAIQCTCLFKSSSRVTVWHSNQLEKPLDRCLK